jgi:AraC-like DNA-binding protein
MEIQNLKPRSGFDTIRLGDSDELVVMENFGSLPKGELSLDGHGLIVICTEGIAQFDYDGQQIRLHKDDLFLYMSHSVVTNFMSSLDFNCRQIWFSRGELWNINKYGEVSLSNLPYLKRHPIMHLTEDDVKLLDDYFQLLCRRMRDSSPVLYSNIVRSLVSTMMLEILSMMRRQEPENTVTTDVHRQRLANEFMRLVEQSDGRIRKVDDFANQLNITPKYLSTLLKETMNRRPSEMIHFYTLKAIEHRLRYTDMTMQEIANDLNFANASFFGKYFKEHAGMTPLDFRKKYHP